MPEMFKVAPEYAPLSKILCATFGILVLLAGIVQTQNAYAEDDTRERRDQTSEVVSADFTFVKAIFGSVVLVSTKNGLQKPNLFPKEHLLVQSDDAEVINYALTRAKIYGVDIDIVEGSQRYRIGGLGNLNSRDKWDFCSKAA